MTLSTILAFVLGDGWAEFIHRAGMRVMVLTNLLNPIATGQKITPEIFDAIMAEVRKTKREIAVEAQRLQEGL